jgi:signal transduction histidine kinase
MPKIGVATGPSRRAEAPRREQVIAAGRAVLSVTVLAALYLNLTGPARYGGPVYGLLAAYVVYAIGVLLLMRRFAISKSPVVLHVVDLVWAATITSATGGAVSPMTMLFTFAMMASAFRWGLFETVATTVAASSLTLAETWLVPQVPMLALDPPVAVDLNYVLVRIAGQMTLGLVLGYLAEQEKRWRGELLAIASVMKRPTVASGMSGTMRAVGEELLRLFRAREVLFVAREAGATQVALWRIAPDDAGVTTARLERLPPAAGNRYYFDAPKAWHLIAREPEAVIVEDLGGAPVRHGAVDVNPAFFDAHPCRSVLGVHIKLLDAGDSRVFVLDSDLPPRESSLRFLLTLIDYVAPAIHNVYLLRRLRARAGAAERARVARELHDGAIQSLVGLEMELEALRHRAATLAPALEPDLGYMQQAVARQVLDLRELMTQLRPLDLESTDQLPDLLATMVEKFRRDTGISARFVSSAERVSVSPRAALELARIVQESLVNVRRHSRAGNVLVTLGAQAGLYRLCVEDDGRGFNFSGRLTDREMDAQRQGPTVIRERARVIGASLAIESHPGKGARLELTLPEAAHA